VHDVKKYIIFSLVLVLLLAVSAPAIAAPPDNPIDPFNNFFQSFYSGQWTGGGVPIGSNNPGSTSLFMPFGDFDFGMGTFYAPPGPPSPASGDEVPEFGW
jgi:hypothetical protein